MPLALPLVILSLACNASDASGGSGAIADATHDGSALPDDMLATGGIGMAANPPDEGDVVVFAHDCNGVGVAPVWRPRHHSIAELVHPQP